MLKNESGLKPLGRAVLLAFYEPERVASLIEIPDFVQAKQQMVDQRAIVIEVGSEAWKDEIHARAKPGDKVMVSKYAGVIVAGPADGKPYRVVNANDVFMAITEEKVSG